jgi:ABC-type microcin C transport system permease subunit YejB
VSKRYLIRRLLLVVPVLLGTILIVFALVFLTPGDPVSRLAGNKPLAESTYNEITWISLSWCSTSTTSMASSTVTWGRRSPAAT